MSEIPHSCRTTMSSAMSSPANSAPGTPTRGRSQSPMLTPRSKVRALLAEMDSGSDDDDDGDKDIGELMRKAAKPPMRMEKRKGFVESSEDEEENVLEEEDEEEEVMVVEDEPVRPRGKMAARMMAAHVDTKTTGAVGKDGNVYERVRKSIFGGEDEIEQEKEINSPPRSAQQNDNDDEDEDEDDDIPLPTSRRKKTPLKPSAQRNSPNPASPSSPSKPAPQSRGATPPVVEQDSDSDALPANLLGNDRFLALVARKRKEREDKEAAEALKIASRRAALDAQRGPSEDEDEDDSGADNVASQRAPTRRKAGKKALEEMHKETQRMARSMQLAHQARTRKKITKQSLFDKFNFRPEQAEEPVDSRTSREVVAMDVDMNAELPCVEQMPKDPPPPEQMDLDGETTPRSDKGKGKGKAVIRVTDDDQARDKGKGKGKPVEKKSPGSKKTQFKLPAVRVILPPQPASDSDSDLEIIAPVTPQSEHRKMLQSLRAVRRASPPKMRKAGQLTTKELRAELLLKGRQQAIQEREEQIQELKAKGIIVLTAEERANTNNQVEDLLEKARLQSLAIKRHEKRMEAKEKGTVKKEPGAGGDEDEDDEEDDDWLEEAEAGSVLDELSGSGSEEEGGGEKEVVNDFSDEEKDSGEDEEGGTGTPVFSLSSMYPRDQASPSATPRLSEIPAAYIDDEADDDDSDSGEFAPLKKKSQIKKQQRKKMRVVEGDEDDDDDDNEATMETAREQKEQKSNIPAIFQRADDAPAFPGMGMTQLFAGTIGASGEFQMQDSQDGIAALRRGARDMRPNSQMLDFDGSSQDISQHESSRLRLDYTQSQVWLQEPLQESLPRVVLDYEKELEVDDMPDPTQDVGFEYGSSQTAPPRFTQSQEDAPDSSISTQVLDSQFGIHRKRRGRLTRRETEFSDVEEEEVERADEEDEEVEKVEEVEDVVENVFDLMKKASKKKPKREPVDMEKLRADTKGLVHDQAEESEDEYAGIGGASDDEADAGRDSEMEDLMDDTNNETVDEAGIAAYYAEREKIQDEKDVNKLLKDLQSGLLRKKRGAEFDLDDSDDDDDGEARRRAKRRQMAKMRKELMKDGNIEKIANNPKRLAFLSAIEDRDRDEEMDFLDRGEEDLFVELGMVSQSQDVGQSLETSQSPDQGNSDNEASPTPGPIEEEDPESRSKEASREITPLPIPQSKRLVKNKASSLAQVREVSLFRLCE